MVPQRREHYNKVRPHSALGYRPPAPEAIVPSWPVRLRSAPPAAQLGLSGRSGLTLLLDHQVQAVQMVSCAKESDYPGGGRRN